MEGLSVREIRCEDYHDIYLLNQEFNSERSDFSAEKVKERIQYIIKNTRDIVLVCELCSAEGVFTLTSIGNGNTIVNIHRSIR